MTHPHHHHTAASIAGALRQLADRLEATPVRDHATVALSVDLLVTTTTGTPLALRREAVDIYAAHLDLGAPDPASPSYGADKLTGHVNVHVYTATTTDQDNPYVR